MAMVTALRMTVAGIVALWQVTLFFIPCIVVCVEYYCIVDATMARV